MPKKPTVSPVEQAWRDKNPLRKWLNSQRKKADGQTIITLHEAIGVERATIYAWMYGWGVPSAESFVELQKHAGVDFYAWMAWLKKKPTEAKEAVGASKD